eukprot:1128681_1
MILSNVHQDQENKEDNDTKQFMANCDPGSNTCSQWQSCLNRYDLSTYIESPYEYSFENDTIYIYFDNQHNNLISSCIYDDKPIAFAANISLFCYIPTNVSTETEMVL